MKLRRTLLTLKVLFILTLFFHGGTPVLATPEYAQDTGLECRACHIDPAGGSQLTSQGKLFLEELKAKGRYHQLSFLQHAVRFIIGYLHMMGAIMWFGAIMYVHLLLKPSYASQGFPREN